MNTELLSLLGHCFVSVAINLFAFLIFHKQYGEKYRKKYYIISFFMAVLLMIAVSQINEPYVNMVYSYVSINAICLIMYESDWKKVWIYNLLIWFIFLCCDAVTVLIWSVVEGNTLEGTLSNNQLMLGSNLLNIILLFTAYRVLLLFVRKISFNSVQLKIALLMISITFFETWIIISYSSQISNRMGGVHVIIMLLGFLLINLFLTYVLSIVSKSYQYEHELCMIKQLQEMQLENYKETEQKYKESRAIIHDIKKHLNVLEDLEKEDAEKAKEYRDHINMQMDKIFCGFHCSNRIMGIIFSQKMSRAKSEGIRVDVSVDEINMDFISDIDITAVFANLWDNAIEACRKAGQNKYIIFSVSKFNGFLLINLVNSFNGICKTKGRAFLTTKEHHEGIGLSSIQASVDKYDGIFKTEVNEKVFKSEITIPIPPKKDI